MREFWILIAVVLVAAGGVWLACHSLQEEARREKKIFEEGVEAARDGMPPTACPYPSTSTYSWETMKWKRGWQEGFRSISKPQVEK
jgi:hypothetical protein